MEAFLDAGLANALAVLILAPLVAVMARLIRRPAVAHAMWLIVVLKLITPSWVSVPILPAARPEVVAVAAPLPARVVEVEPPAREEAVTFRVVGSEPARNFPASGPVRRSWDLPPWRVIVMSSWMAGSAAWGILAAWRVSRFARLLRRADPADESLRDQVAECAATIGLRRVPRVVFMPGRVSPMVWSLGGRPCLVLPEALWERLGEDQKAALLVHELAHLRRRDHWVRGLELVATGLYWWHPALWWARRGLHEAEEQCCDLWVVWALPQAAKRYATALVEAVDFLSQGGPSLTLGASGMGQVHDLSRRIGMIMRGTTPRALSRAGFFTTLGLAALLLPLRPSWSQQPKAEVAPAIPPPATTAPEESPLPAAIERPAAPAAKPGDTPEANASDPAKDDELEEIKVKVSSADYQLKRAQALRRTMAVGEQEVRAAEAELAIAKAQLAQGLRAAEMKRRTIRENLAKAHDEVELLEGERRVKKALVNKAQAQRQLPMVEMSRIKNLENKGKGYVSNSEMAKATAELAIADAAVVEAKADLDIVEVQIRQAERRRRLLEEQAKPKARAETTPPAPSGLRDPSGALKRIGLAMHLHQLDMGRFPAASTRTFNAEGKPLLSWRVAILPYLEDPAAKALYKEFHLNEPWDSEHNKSLLSQMPQVFLLDNRLDRSEGTTHYRAIVGPQAAMNVREGFALEQFTDMTKNTLVVVESGEAVPWTKPEDIPFPLTIAASVPDLGTGAKEGFHALFADGTVRYLKLPLAPNVFAALATKSGGEILDEYQYGRDPAAIGGGATTVGQRFDSRFAPVDDSPRAAQARDPEQRLADVESKLDRVLKELEELRKGRGAQDDFAKEREKLLKESATRDRLLKVLEELRKQSGGKDDLDKILEKLKKQEEENRKSGEKDDAAKPRPGFYGK